MLKTKFFKLLTTAAIVATMAVPVMAEGETSNVNSYTAAGTGESKVTYTQESAFTVTIPKNIALQSDKQASYEVSVIGDIQGNQKVEVKPAESFMLKDSHGKTDVTATVTQSKTSFASDEIKDSEHPAKTTGTISAPGLTSGDWSGQLNFTVGINSTTNNNEGIITTEPEVNNRG